MRLNGRIASLEAQQQVEINRIVSQLTDAEIDTLLALGSGQPATTPAELAVFERVKQVAPHTWQLFVIER